MRSVDDKLKHWCSKMMARAGVKTFWTNACSQELEADCTDEELTAHVALFHMDDSCTSVDNKDIAVEPVMRAFLRRLVEAIHLVERLCTEVISITTAFDSTARKIGSDTRRCTYKELYDAAILALRDFDVENPPSPVTPELMAKLEDSKNNVMALKKMVNEQDRLLATLQRRYQDLNTSYVTSMVASGKGSSGTVDIRIQAQLEDIKSTVERTQDKFVMMSV